VLRRARTIWGQQAPVLLPAALVVFVFAAAEGGGVLALASALTLITVVFCLAWTSPSG
jgi:hypothetical protein